MPWHPRGPSPAGRNPTPGAPSGDCHGPWRGLAMTGNNPQGPAMTGSNPRGPASAKDNWRGLAMTGRNQHRHREARSAVAISGGGPGGADRQSDSAPA